MSLPLVIHSSFYIVVEFSIKLLGACTAVFGCCSHCQLLSILLVSVFVFRCNCCAWCLGLLESEVPFLPCSLAPPFSSTKEIPVGWGPLAGLPWIPPPHARALPGSTNFEGTNAQAHLLVMSLIFNRRKGILYLHVAYNVRFTTQITNCWHSKKVITLNTRIFN